MHVENEENSTIINFKRDTYLFPEVLKIHQNMTETEIAVFHEALEYYKDGVNTRSDIRRIAANPSMYDNMGRPIPAVAARSNLDALNERVSTAGDYKESTRIYHNTDKPNLPLALHNSIKEGLKEMRDAINQYRDVEVIDITEQLNFNRGNAVKYVARAGFKSEDTEIQDLQKAKWYVEREIIRIDDQDDSFSYTADAEALVEQMNYNRGSAVACVSHAGTLDTVSVKDDLYKAIRYIDREIALLKTYKED